MFGLRKDYPVLPNPMNPPDAMPLREALRGLRFLLRRGGETLADTMTTGTLPRPAQDLATNVLREVSGLVRSVDQVASNVAKSVLGGQGSSTVPLQELLGQEDAASNFAQAIYAALSAVLRRFGAQSFFVSEMAARTTFFAWRKSASDSETEAQAADLILDLLEARVIRGTATGKTPTLPEGALDAAAVFAVLLWLQSARSEAENEAALDAAADIALAKASEVVAAVRTLNRDQLAVLFRKYVDHV